MDAEYTSHITQPDGALSEVPRGLAPATVDEADAGRHVGYSAGHMRNMRAQRRGPVFLRLKGRIRYRIADLDAWLAEHVVVPGEVTR
jgi:hypothetical protein